MARRYHEGEVLDMLVQRRRDKRAALRLMREQVIPELRTRGPRHHPLVIAANGEQYKNIRGFVRRCAMFFSFPEDAHWNADLQAVEFGVGVGEYRGLVRVPRQVFRRFIDGAVTPERCVELYHLQRTRFERIAERKLRNRQLADDGNVEITGRDLRVPRQPSWTGAMFSSSSECEWPQARN